MMGNLLANQVDLSLSPEISQAIHSGDPEQELIGCQMTHKLLDPFPPPHSVIKAIAESGILPKCVKLLRCPNPETRVEAAWIVSKMTWLVRKRLVRRQLLKFGLYSPMLRAVKNLGNQTLGFIPHLVTLAVSPESQVPLLRYVARTLAKMSSRPKQFGFGIFLLAQTVRTMLPALVRLINVEDAEVVADACSALAQLLASGGPIVIEEILNTGLAFRLIQILSSKERKIVSWSLDAIQNLVRGHSHQVERILGSGPIIQMLGRLMETPGSDQRALAIVSRITYGGGGQVNLVINGGLVPILIRIIQNGNSLRKEEAAKIVKKLTNPASRHRIPYFCQCGVIPAICSLLKTKPGVKDDDWPVQMALETLSQILDASEGEKLLEYRKMVEDYGGLDSLDQLQDEHEDSEAVGDGSKIYKLAVKIVDKHFQDNPSRDGVRAAKIQKMDI